MSETEIKTEPVKSSKSSAQERVVTVQTLVKAKNLMETVFQGARNLHIYEAYQTEEWRHLGHSSFEAYCFEAYGLHKSVVYEIVQNVDLFGIHIAQRFAELGISVRSQRKARALPPEARAELILAIDLKDGSISKRQIAQIIDSFEQQISDHEKDIALHEKHIKEAKQQIRELKAGKPADPDKQSDLTELDLTVTKACRALGFIYTNPKYTDEEMTRERVAISLQNLRSIFQNVEGFLGLKLRIALDSEEKTKDGKNS